VFARFTEPARQAVVLAQDEARSLGQAFIAPDHLFLGLIREERGLARRVLDSLGVDDARARADVEARYGSGDGPATGQIPFTAEAKKVLELALREALSLRHDYVGTEHLLLGLARVGTDAFAPFGLGGEQVREAVLAALSA
jgi:ATP-dependent Clp protease ATP-binding subunit ClpC